MRQGFTPDCVKAFFLASDTSLTVLFAPHTTLAVFLAVDTILARLIEAWCDSAAVLR